MRPRLIILYEDSRGPLKRFPLHELVVKSAADLVALEVYDIFRRVVGVPKRGVNKVLDSLAERASLPARGAVVLAWVDNDAIRRAVQLAPNCSREVVISEIKARASEAGAGPKQIEVFILDNNLEDLLLSVGTRLDPTLLERALAKRLDARDILLDEISRSPQLRAALRESHAGFDCVSRFVACVSAMPQWPILR